jgi:hypothetical protein
MSANQAVPAEFTALKPISTLQGAPIFRALGSRDSVEMAK